MSKYTKVHLKSPLHKPTGAPGPTKKALEPGWAHTPPANYDLQSPSHENYYFLLIFPPDNNSTHFYAPLHADLMVIISSMGKVGHG